MTKASLTSASTRHVLWLGWKLAILISIYLCVVALVRLQRYSQAELSSSAPRSHRSRILNRDFEGPPKVAFMFLARRNLPLDFLWGKFFEGFWSLQKADVANFSIYIHSEPGFMFNESTTTSSFFYNRQLSNSIKVAWGEASMIQAERLLIEAALEDPANQRFVLLSDSCVPLYNFSYIYSYLTASPRSFVDSFLDEKEGRYNPKMAPILLKNKWRKGSQWIALVRSHAEVVVDDKFIFPVFLKFCKRRPPLEAGNGKQNIILQKKHNCIPDEHYLPTLFAMNNLEGELARRTVTYTSWNQSATNMERKGWHPLTFSYANADPQQIKGIKDINHVYYETEDRTEWCSSNSTSVPCFLFARKFSRGAAMRLLNGGVVGSSDAS